MSLLGNHIRVRTAKTERTNKERAHRYKQDVEKSYVLQLLMQKEKQVKETKNEKVQEV
jgi:hypothetical protein